MNEMSKEYKSVTVHNHPLFPGRRQVLRSRLVMAESLGRSLLRSELVHHKNENTLDDRRKNLKIMLRGKHTIYHHTGSHRTVESKRKMSLAKKGKPLTAEHKLKMSAAQKGEKNGMFGKHHTVESNHKNSLAHKGKHPTDETRKKLSISNVGFRGRYHTTKTRRRMSLSQKERRMKEIGISCLNLHAS